MSKTLYAKEFREIPTATAQNTGLRNEMLRLIDSDPIVGKVLEGNDRLLKFKEVLKELVMGTLSLPEAYSRTETEIPRHISVHANNNKVFASGWAERLVRIQYSRFYNQAVLQHLLSENQTRCFIPHSSEEDSSSSCSRFLAGSIHDTKVLYDRLVEAYAHGNWSKDLKVPDHPHCTHVVIPIE